MPLACAYLTLGGGEEKENRRSLLLGLGEVRAASPLWMQTAVGRFNNLRRGGEHLFLFLVADGEARHSPIRRHYDLRHYRSISRHDGTGVKRVRYRGAHG